jgi:organic radical activating enzyme
MNNDIKGDQVEETGDALVSKFYSDAQSVKPLLDSVSPSFCLAKWQQVSLHLTTGHNNSCYHPPLHQVSLDAIKINPSALHNTDHKKQQRIMMLRGERPKECSYCWAIEDAGNLSDRQYRSAEPWAIKDYDSIKKMRGHEDVIPSYVEVNFSNLCNLQCSYCSPQFSSSWGTEVAEHGAFPTNPPHNDPEYFKGSRRPIPIKEANPYVDAFWEWWPTLYPKLEHFRMTGGEPLMDKNTYKVFDYVLANPKPNLHLNVTSNFSQEPRIFNKYLNYVKALCAGDNIEHFMQYVSLDCWGKQAEYSRHGLEFEMMWENVIRYMQEVPYKNSITFIVTMHNLSLSNQAKLLEQILELRKQFSQTYQRVWFDTPYLRQPYWQSLQILPSEYSRSINDSIKFMQDNLETASNRFHGFKDYEVQRMERVRDWMLSPSGRDVTQDRANFYQFFNAHDQRRGTDFLKTFPEMTEFWNECKNIKDHATS